MRALGRTLRCRAIGRLGLALAVVVMGAVSRPAAATQEVYYRVVVRLTYEGRDLDIDFVGGCGVSRTTDLAGGRSREIAGMSALVYAVEVPGGHAVKVRSIPPRGSSLFDPCRGDTTASGKVPKDWLPFVVWYEDAKDLSFGVGYATSDAYRNPNARLGFRGAEILSATRQEFEAFERSGPRNVVPRHLTDWLYPVDGAPLFRSVAEVPQAVRDQPRLAWPALAPPTCRALMRIRLTQPQREVIRGFWPGDWPGLWAPDWKTQADLLTNLVPPVQRERGLARSADPDEFSPRVELFPITSSDALPQLTPRTGSDGRFNRDAHVGDGLALRGFAYCESLMGPVVYEAVTGRSFPKHFLGLIDCRIDGRPVPLEEGQCFSPQWIAFERDEYAYVFFDAHQG